MLFQPSSGGYGGQAASGGYGSGYGGQAASGGYGGGYGGQGAAIPGSYYGSGVSSKSETYQFLFYSNYNANNDDNIINNITK